MKRVGNCLRVVDHFCHCEVNLKMCHLFAKTTYIQVIFNIEQEREKILFKTNEEH